MYTVVRYNKSYAEQWNAFIEQSKNGTFLFNRNFMEYHADKFEDFSVLIFEGKKLMAVFPAHVKEGTVYSHLGLTYGDIVITDGAGFEKTLRAFYELLKLFHENGISNVYLKKIPLFYYKSPAFETDYILNRLKAQLSRKDMNLAIDFNKPFTVAESKLKNFRKRKNIGFSIEKGAGFKFFWDEILLAVLEKKYQSKPIHSLAEIELLHERFPENIVQYNLYFEDKILAGITLFIFDGVIKSQYGAATPEGEKMRALDFLFIFLIEEYKDQKSFFDMGTVMAFNGINKGLLKQKEEFGCSIYTQDFYELTTANYVLLDNVII